MTPEEQDEALWRNRFIMINLVVDLLYFVVDPRLRGPGAARAGH